MSYRTSSALPASKKTHSEKNKQILKQLLKEECNKVCSDCKTAVHPRWASWNLGCFVCIRCSGIHRSMGTHISRVKSVDLDSWTDEQVESMVKWGNERCNVYWEAQLPDGYVPDQSKIENFIRTKYDLKKWVLSSKMVNPLTLETKSKSVGTTASAPLQAARSTTQSASEPNLLGGALDAPGAKSEPNLLDDDFGSFTSSKSSVNHFKSESQAVKTQSKSIPLPKVPTSQINSRQSTGGSLNGSINSGAGTRPDLKKSILSLYSSPSPSASNFMQPQNSGASVQGVAPTSGYPSIQTATSANSLVNSLNGLNFNSVPSKSASNTGSQISLGSNVSNGNTSVQSTSTTTPVWNNEWSDVSTNNNKKWDSASNKGVNVSQTLQSGNLDDDIFKNVWT